MRKKQLKTTELKQQFLIDDEGLECPVKYIDRNVLNRHNVVEKVINKVLEAQDDLKHLKKELFKEVKGFLDMVASDYGEDWKGNAKLLNFDKTKEIEMSIHRPIRFDERLNIAKSKIEGRRLKAHDNDLLRKNAKHFEKAKSVSEPQKQCLKRWSGNAQEELKMIVLRAFNIDKKGNVDIPTVDYFMLVRDTKCRVRQILALKQFRFDDPVWQEAMNIIDESITTTNSKVVDSRLTIAICYAMMRSIMSKHKALVSRRNKNLIFSVRDNPRGQFKTISLNFSNLDVN